MESFARKIKCQVVTLSLFHNNNNNTNTHHTLNAFFSPAKYSQKKRYASPPILISSAHEPQLNQSPSHLGTVKHSPVFSAVLYSHWISWNVSELGMSHVWREFSLRFDDVSTTRVAHIPTRLLLCDNIITKSFRRGIHTLK